MVTIMATIIMVRPPKVTLAVAVIRRGEQRRAVEEAVVAIQGSQSKHRNRS